MSLPTVELEDAQIHAISKILGDGLSNSQISEVFELCNLVGKNPSFSKFVRIFSTLKDVSIQSCSTNCVWKFIQQSFKLVKHRFALEQQKALICKINQVIIESGFEIRDDCDFYPTEKVVSLSEILKRTDSLRTKLTQYHAHEYVLKYCSKDFLEKDYFHTVHEAAKSLCKKVRELSDLKLDGAKLFETALSVKDPYIKMSDLSTESLKNQQVGLCKMLCGIVSMIRNPTAHEMRMDWEINESDAIDILLVISFLHKMLDKCRPVPRDEPGNSKRPNTTEH